MAIDSLTDLITGPLKRFIDEPRDETLITKKEGHRQKSNGLKWNEDVYEEALDLLEEELANFILEMGFDLAQVSNSSYKKLFTELDSRHLSDDHYTGLTNREKCAFLEEIEFVRPGWDERTFHAHLGKQKDKVKEMRDIFASMLHKFQTQGETLLGLMPAFKYDALDSARLGEKGDPRGILKVFHYVAKQWHTQAKYEKYPHGAIQPTYALNDLLPLDSIPDMEKIRLCLKYLATHNEILGTSIE